MDPLAGRNEVRNKKHSVPHRCKHLYIQCPGNHELAELAGECVDKYVHIHIYIYINTYFVVIKSGRVSNRRQNSKGRII